MARGHRAQEARWCLRLCPPWASPDRQAGGCGHGQARCGQRPQDAHLSHHCRGLPEARQPGSVF